MKTLKKVLTSLSIAASLFVLSGNASVSAQGQAITVIPPKFELFGNPGDIVNEKIRIRNESDFPGTYTIVVEDFSSAGEEGHVVLEEESSDTSYSLANWIEPETKDLILQPGEERTFNFNINIPRTAEPGGHYASILFQSGGDPVPGVASVTQRIGSLVLFRVSGNVVEDATIETFEAPSYSKEGPVPFTLRMRNDGNTHIRPKGTIIITNMFNKKIEEIPLQGANVLPGATRKMDTTTWDKESILGYYTATLVATYGQTNLPLTAATKFLVISPTMAIIISVGTLAGLIFIISLFSGRKRLSKALKVILSGD